MILYGAPWIITSLVLNTQLRFQGSAVYGMVGITSGAVVNIALDPLLIFALDLEIAGAAWATVISQFLGFCLLLAGCAGAGTCGSAPLRSGCAGAIWPPSSRAGCPPWAGRG